MHSKLWPSTCHAQPQTMQTQRQTLNPANPAAVSIALSTRPRALPRATALCTYVRRTEGYAGAERAEEEFTMRHTLGALRYHRAAQGVQQGERGACLGGLLVALETRKIVWIIVFERLEQCKEAERKHLRCTHALRTAKTQAKAQEKRLEKTPQEPQGSPRRLLFCRKPTHTRTPVRLPARPPARLCVPDCWDRSSAWKWPACP